MKWIIDFLLSSLGKKLIMSLTGLFLCLFLVVHMLGNLQLFFDNTGEAFNTYAYTMTTNPLIKIISYGNYFFILLHAVAYFGISWLAHVAILGTDALLQNGNSGI